MQARDVMITDVVTVTPQTPVPDIARRLLERRISGAPVVDSAGRLVGMVSEGDLMRQTEGAGGQRSWWLQLLSGNAGVAKDYTKDHGRRAEHVMSSDLITVGEDTPIGEIARTLEKHRIKRVPVVRDDRLVGIVSRADLLQAIAAGPARQSDAPTDDRTIRQAVLTELANVGFATGGINVMVNDGVVSLWGLVASDEERRALALAAENTPGAKAVENNLVVSSGMMRHY